MHLMLAISVSYIACVLLCVYSSFAVILIGKRELITLFFFLVSRDCSVALPHDATALSAVFYCGIS